MTQLTFISLLTQMSGFLFGTDDQQLISLFSTWLIVMTVVVLVCFIVSEITRNYSQVDKLWSLMPIVYCLLTFTAMNQSPRIWVMTFLVILWGFRLTYNFNRKGGYNLVFWRGEEDYRWNYLRQHTILRNQLKFSIFNFLFISFYQHLLILLFTTPILLAAKYWNEPLNWLDYVAGALMLLFIGIESIADNQQFRFQQMKRGKIKNTGQFGNSLKNGFLHEGIWKYARHPNFAAEQMIWVSFYLFSVAASGQWLNWTASGAVLLILLFIGSSTLTENISKSKYPAYADYQENVARFVPGFRRFAVRR